MYDVHVIGAGPAGCMAAKSACKQGARVLVSEEHETAGQPERCSGLVSKAGLDSFGFDYSEAILNRIYGARIYSPSGNCLEVKTKKEVAFVISRTVFDSLCAESAETAGAKIEYGKRIRKSGLNGRKIIGADGLNSGIAEWYDFPPITNFISCFQADYENAEVGERDRVEVFLSNEFAPGFFAWVIPLDEGKARVGLGAFPQANSKKCFQAFLKHPRVKSAVERARVSSSFAYCIPLKPRSRTGKGRVFIAGNAAGQVKATTGGGVFFGGACGKIAGQFAARNFSGEEYDRAWRSEFGKDLALHERARSFCNSLDDFQIERYFSMAKILKAESFLSAYGHMDRPSLMLPHLNLFPPLKAAYALIETRAAEGEAHA